MRIQIKTAVSPPPQKVFKKFDQELFLALAPPLMPMKLLRFDGCKIGDEVHIQLPFRTKWVSIITDNQVSDEEIYFIDENKNKEIPFPLKRWKHKHRILKNGQGSLIIDDISYQTHSIITDYMVYPFLYIQFLYRRPIYKTFFSKKNI